MFKSKISWLLSKRAIGGSYLTLMAALLLSSCASVVGVGGGDNFFVSAQIENSSREVVNASVKSVFQEEGFTLIGQSGNELHFQKWGGRTAEIIYGSLLTDGVAIEPEVTVNENGAGRYLVGCDVYMREHGPGELINTDWKVLKSGKSAYRKLLKKVKAQSEGR